MNRPGRSLADYRAIYGAVRAADGQDRAWGQGENTMKDWLLLIGRMWPVETRRRSSTTARRAHAEKACRASVIGNH